MHGPYFTDTEFSTLMALTREEMAAISTAWPVLAHIRDADAEAGVTNALVHLLNYPHGQEKLPAWEEDIQDALAWWQSGKRPEKRGD
ncbi:hypothetical protein Afil01_61080 [Actinorhabdospora filicis]|uniref:Uncharacterized protein n=1 Tax=Actinorhabdospora filicis TaxID=1785913 RepID=A0A9W6SRY9_9ACTN|nr:hypothetical protein [Actinorhabdospora filicis]GLZ81301.1 hypothetical protein Afil01_61080 [Actinorhabdospora filicis]